MPPDDKPDTNKGIIFIVVLGLVINATIGVVSLAYCLVFRVAVEQAFLTVFVGIVTYLLGVLSGILSKTSPTAATTSSPSAGIPPIPPPPTKVVVENKPDNPVQTEEVK